jgi:hypothetical protein
MDGVMHSSSYATASVANGGDSPLLTLPPDFLETLIELVHQFHAGAAVDIEHDPVAQELCDMLAGLNGDQLAELIALIGLGRGDFPVSQWEERCQESPWRTPRWSLDELFVTPKAIEYLEDGLAALRRWA